MEANPRATLVELAFGFAPSQLVYVMARLRIADLLADGPLSVAELSSTTQSQPAMLRRLLRGLAGAGLVKLEADDRASLTELGALLDSRAQGSMRDVALHFGGEAFAAWAKLEHSIQTGQAAFEAAHGQPFFSYLESHPEAGAAFNGTMTAMSHGVVAQAIEAYDFPSASRVLDIGGGQGHFVASVLEAHAGLEGAVFDLPHVNEAAAAFLAARSLGERCVVVNGSFFDSLPAGYDLHLLKWIVHDWNDDDALKLLAASHAALPADGRLLIIERLLPDVIEASTPIHPAIRSDLNMLVNFADAVERSRDEFEQLLGAAGFALHEVMTLPSGFSTLDCRPRALS